MWPFRKKRGDELNHWIASAENFNYSPKTFYEELEKTLAERKIPDLTMDRVEFAEGGLLSAERTYLRMQRERLLFDVCAAPFGTGYFFSCRTVKLPVVVKLWHILVLCIVLNSLWAGFFKLFGLIPGTGLWLLLLIALVLTLHNAATASAVSVDALLTRIPVIGTIYEAWFKRDTYFRVDSRLMYLDLIPNLVQKLSETVTSANGVRLVRQYQTAPILGELYKPVSFREPNK
jgi:hypothetical protein